MLPKKMPSVWTMSSTPLFELTLFDIKNKKRRHPKKSDELWLDNLFEMEFSTPNNQVLV